MEGDKQRVIQEYVSGKQVTLAHIIANPGGELYKKIGLVTEGESNAIGILTITPSEAAIIAGDAAAKAGSINIGFIDRFSGSLVITGELAAVESAVENVLSVLSGTLQFSIAYAQRLSTLLDLLCKLKLLTHMKCTFLLVCNATRLYS